MQNFSILPISIPTITARPCLLADEDVCQSDLLFLQQQSHSLAQLCHGQAWQSWIGCSPLSESKFGVQGSSGEAPSEPEAVQCRDHWICSFSLGGIRLYEYTRGLRYQETQEIILQISFHQIICPKMLLMALAPPFLLPQQKSKRPQNHPQRSTHLGLERIISGPLRLGWLPYCKHF